MRPDRDRCALCTDVGPPAYDDVDNQFSSAYDSSSATFSSADFDNATIDDFRNANFFFPTGATGQIVRIRVCGVASGSGVIYDVRTAVAGASDYSSTYGTSLTTADVPTTLSWVTLKFPARAANETFLMVLGGTTPRVVTLYDINTMPGAGVVVL